MEAVADGLFFFGFLIGVTIEPGSPGFCIDFCSRLGSTTPSSMHNARPDPVFPVFPAKLDEAANAEKAGLVEVKSATSKL